ncbi:MAG: hypothetical protein ACYC35_19685 [Pirellulales bacterium]
MITEALKIEPPPSESLKELPLDVGWLVEALIEAGKRDDQTVTAPRATGLRLAGADDESLHRGAPARRLRTGA